MAAGIDALRRFAAVALTVMFEAWPTSGVAQMSILAATVDIERADVSNARVLSGMRDLVASVRRANDVLIWVDPKAPNVHRVDASRFPASVVASTAQFGSFCGGVLVGPKAVLTAAHCLESAAGHVEWSCANKAAGSARSIKWAPKRDSTTTRGNPDWDLAVGALDRELACSADAAPYASLAPGPTAARGQLVMSGSHLVRDTTGFGRFDGLGGVQVDIVRQPRCDAATSRLGQPRIAPPTFAPWIVQHGDSGHGLFEPVQGVGPLLAVRGILVNTSAEYVGMHCGYAQNLVAEALKTLGVKP